MQPINLLKRLAQDNAGATAIEYGLIVSLVVIAMMASLDSVASATTEMWGEVEAEMVAANS